ncbi:hypothetical protein VE02_07529 [Pseudogymnoascus sp. 03VT05]|nr:hypothetical protein VE02_07529 [Pseudogymnoascus sp. 03VT05]
MDPIANPDVLIQQLKALIANPEAFSTRGTEIIQLSRQAAVALEGPFETFQRLAYSALPLVSARIAQEHNIFQTLIANKDEPTSVTVLSEKTKINPVVLDILLDYLSTQFITVSFTCTRALQPLIFTPVDFYNYLESHPVQGAAFHRFIEAQFASLPTWLDVLPFDSEYAASATPETPIFVDAPAPTTSAKSSTTTTTRPATSSSPPTSPPSPLLRHPHRREGPPRRKARNGDVEYTAVLSLAMKAMFNALERREGQWRTLLADAGLEIREIRRYTDFKDSIIVAGRKA